MGISASPYGSASGVARKARFLLESTSASNFSASTAPTLTEMNALLLEGAREMDLEFAGTGLTTPLTASELKAVLSPVNEYYGAAMAFFTRSVSRGFTDTEEGEGRGGVWWGLFRKAMDRLVKDNCTALVRLGAGRAVALSAGLSVPSISIAEREDAYDDTDWDKPFFKRKLFDYDTGASP